jgi:predicted GNAT family acetyltransferase
MRVTAHGSASDFAGQVMPFLLRREAENCQLIGRVNDLLAAGSRRAQDPSRQHRWSVEDGGDVVAAAMMSPPHAVFMTAATSSAAEALAEHLQETGVEPPGVVAPVPTTFADAWCATRKCGQAVARELRLFRLDRVVPPRRTSGMLREAAADDAPLVISWWVAFSADIGEPREREQVERVAAPALAEGRVFLWCDPGPVCLATWAGPTPGGARVNLVYTPPEYRGRGYASACVAALSQRLLDSGRRFCFVFTDVASPTPNRIYQTIGYRRVCDFRHVTFTPPR